MLPTAPPGQTVEVNEKKRLDNLQTSIVYCLSGTHRTFLIFLKWDQGHQVV